MSEIKDFTDHELFKNIARFDFYAATKHKFYLLEFLKKINDLQSSLSDFLSKYEFL